MAKKSSIEKNNRRRKMVARFAERRETLKRTAADQSISEQDRFQARLKLAALPRNSAAVRIRNRCEVTGRPRGNYRKFKMSRIALRELGAQGLIPGLVKSSW
jgi:small subunit ribosomal protein S14